MKNKIVYVCLGMLLYSSALITGCSDDDKNNIITPLPVDSLDFRLKESINYTNIANGTYYNYFSKYGLLKNSIFYNDIMLTTISDPDGIGTFDISQETVIS